MAKEDSIAELKHEIKSLEEKIEELKEAEVPNFGEISRLQDLLEEEKIALEKLTAEMDQNVGNDLENDEDKDKSKNANEQDDESNRSEKENQVENDEDKNVDEQDDEPNKLENEKNEQENMQPEDGKERFTLLEWQIRTGIDIVPDEYLRKKYVKALTEEEFKEILSNENVPKIVKEPGKAEIYLKSPEDWEGVKTSISALEQAIERGNFPVDVNDYSYILLQYDKDKVMDVDEDRRAAGYGKIDEGDIYASIGEEEKQEAEKKVEEELEEELNEENGILADIPKHLVRGIRAMYARDVLEVASKNMMQKSGNLLTNSIVGNFVGRVGKRAFEKLGRALTKDVNNPNPELNDGELEEEWEPQPGGGNPLPH